MSGEKTEQLFVMFYINVIGTTFIVSSINSHCGLFLKYSIGFCIIRGS